MEVVEGGLVTTWQLVCLHSGVRWVTKDVQVVSGGVLVGWFSARVVGLIGLCFEGHSLMLGVASHKIYCHVSGIYITEEHES